MKKAQERADGYAESMDKMLNFLSGYCPDEKSTALHPGIQYIALLAIARELAILNDRFERTEEKEDKSAE